MKWLVAALTLALGGCVSVTELEQSHETLDVISGKTPREYADCVKHKLADSRDPLAEEAHGDGLRLIVPQKLSAGVGPAALVDIDKRGSGSSIKLRERLNNFPLRLGDVRTAATQCISGS
ncbi:hypothetical protein C4Q28_10390 [Pseudomonas sp. SWI6]|uniref:Lipoprotein n=1 Tax=Pseudomonas taiwanensis TaxID=470150 RepID=A0ABR6V1G0_9PSED|nr:MULTISPECIES: hypothetical protein [Pseudomonas]AVD82533.1 hypothetical protein C4Q28_10390 [Pseudomonas sp. SWI6]AVD89488.1 hypothetical protein C4Q26_21095 [Pseudomonas sp. SWI44]MBC3474087.1 hypothetical protein [Pseudomonas taiwanensis]MBC3491473.1 hypothetical protein [Pseudomonas taiwanensis]MDT8924134.1 hypothetical protein [Pseudomonas taiwanensis]